MVIFTSFIELLFFGNIDPQARAVKPGSHADKLRTYISDHVSDIENVLPENEREIYNKILDAQGELDAISALDSFLIGFRLGAGFTYDTFVNTDTPYKDLSETT